MSIKKHFGKLITSANVFVVDKKKNLNVSAREFVRAHVCKRE